MNWQEKLPEVLTRLQSDVEEADWKWLTSQVALDCPDLDKMEPDEVRRRFAFKTGINNSRLTRTFIWQAWLKIMVKEYEPVMGNIRSFWYQHLENFYRSHGLFTPTALEPPTEETYIQSAIPPDDASSRSEDEALDEDPVRWKRTSAEDKLINTMTEVMSKFVEHHIFRYQDEFLFQIPMDSRYLVGRDRRKMLFFTEKEGMWWLCNELHKARNKRSISVMASRGEPSYLTLEYFADQLAALGVSELLIATLCDFDPWGFWIAWNLDHKFRSFCSKEKDKDGKLIPFFKVTTYLLTTPDLFTPEQIKAGRDLSKFKDQTLIQNWLSVTHGVHGKPIGLHIDVVNPRLKRQRVDNWIEDILAHVKPPYPTLPKKAPGKMSKVLLPNDTFGE